MYKRQAALGKLIKAVIADEGVDSYSVEVAQVSDALKAEPVSYTHLDVYKRQVCAPFQSKLL